MKYDIIELLKDKEVKKKALEYIRKIDAIPAHGIPNMTKDEFLKLLDKCLKEKRTIAQILGIKHERNIIY